MTVSFLNISRTQWSTLIAHLLTRFVLLTSASSVILSQTVEPPAWRPTESAPRAEDYAGTEACKSCHVYQCARQRKSQMGRSMIRPNQPSRDHPQLRFQRGPYTYTVRLGGQATLSVENGRERITEPIFAIVGAGDIFQSYLVRHNGSPYRVAVDYLASQHKLGLDTEADPPVSIETAIGRRHSENYVRSCFACHSPASIAGSDIDFVRRPFGNTCEVCHGPGLKHVEAQRAGRTQESALFNPGHLSPKEQSDFCGQCHTTASAMKAQNPQGVQGVISEPYRLEESRCWSPTDKRISCTACHDPHRPIERKISRYDDRCLACHEPTGARLHEAGGNACPVKTQDCVSCHMPKISVPDTPIVYFDHRISVPNRRR